MPFHDLIAAAAILGTALLLGLIAARLACRYVLPALTPKYASGISARLAALTRAGVAALVLTAFPASVGWGRVPIFCLPLALGLQLPCWRTEFFGCWECEADLAS